MAGRSVQGFEVPMPESAERLRDMVFLCADMVDELGLAITNADEYQVPDPDK
jgi:hypothetical protein